tara:strand:- start:3106 stop:3873 length:768 start_codon:yes stop_codon:yes gene_type:complete
MKKNNDYKNLIIKKDNGYLIDDGEDKFKIFHLNKLPRYYRGFKFSQSGTIKDYGLNQFIFLPENSNILNIGANIGEVALGFLHKNFNVNAVEPDMNQYNILKENKKIFDKKYFNSKLIFDIHNIGLSNEQTIKEFYLSPIDNDSTFIQPKNIDRKKYTMIKIESYKIDDLFSHKNIDLIVGDVEGHEPEVLMGATKTLKRCKYVSLDCGKERNGLDTINDTIKILKLNNFKILKRPDEKDNRPVVIGSNNNLFAD